MQPPGAKPVAHGADTARDVTVQPSTSLRKLVADALTDGQINDIALDHFPVVYNEYTPGMSRDEKARRLADYARRQYEGEKLEALVAKPNPAAYAEYQRRRAAES